MANYHIGLDFGTSQTKICVLKIGETHTRSFIKFPNNSYFLPSLITKQGNRFYYGNEAIKGTNYRFFKMAAVEDHPGEGMANNFRMYNQSFDYPPEMLCILYLTYCYKYVQYVKMDEVELPFIGTKLRRLLGGQLNNDRINTFSIKLGIPTDWNTHHNLSRKIKFQSILLISYELAHLYSSLDDFLVATCDELIEKIEEINANLSLLNEKHQEAIDQKLDQYKLSVYPETAAGLSYLLEKKVFANGYYAVMDIGAGTTDVSVIRISNNQLKNYLCSESVSVASNNVYRTYLEEIGESDITFDCIREIAEVYKDDKYRLDEIALNASLKKNHKLLSDAFREMFYTKYFCPTRDAYNDVEVPKNTRLALNGKEIILYGGGSNFEIINSKDYVFYSQSLSQRNIIYSVIPNQDRLLQIQNDDQIFSNQELRSDFKLLILALGLSVVTVSDERNLFYNLEDLHVDLTPYEHPYNYYDVQQAIYQ